MLHTMQRYTVLCSSKKYSETEMSVHIFVPLSAGELTGLAFFPE